MLEAESRCSRRRRRRTQPPQAPQAPPLSSSGIRRWEEGSATRAGPSDCTFSHNLLTAAPLLVLIHPSVPWPLPGHPEAMKMSRCQGYFHTRVHIQKTA